VKAGVNLANPMIVFPVVWLSVLALFNYRLMTHLTGLNTQTVTMVIANVLLGILIYLVMKKRPRKSTEGQATIRSQLVFSRLNRFVSVLILLWTLGAIFEIFIDRGVPLVWALQGDTGRDYRHFGIPSFNGLLNAILLFCTAALFLLFSETRKMSTLFLLCMLLLWPVAVLSRGLFTLQFAQIIGIYMLRNNLRIGVIAKIAAAAAIFIVMFGVLGEIRNPARNDRTVNFFTELVREDAQNTDYYSIGVLWVYAYVTSPINNVNANVTELSPSYLPYYSVVNLFPSVIRREIYPDGDNPPLTLVNTAFTTSTMYAGYIADFGLLGGIVGVALMQIIATGLYVRARTGNSIAARIAFSTLFQTIVISIAWDAFSSLVNLFQLLIVAYWARIEHRSRRRELQQMQIADSKHTQITHVSK